MGSLTFVCEQCLNDFVPARPEQRFCSRTCSGASRSTRLQALCANCGKKFTYIPSTRPGTYCSRTCVFAGRRTAVSVACGWCGNEFERGKSQLSKNKCGVYFCCYAHWRLWNDVRGNGEQSSAEQVLADALSEAGTSYERQACVGGFYPDFLMRSAHLVVEVDGDYYHANPAIYADADLYPVQVRNRQRDRVKNARYARDCYKVVRAWESEVLANVTEVVRRIVAVM